MALAQTRSALWLTAALAVGWTGVASAQTLSLAPVSPSRDIRRATMEAVRQTGTPHGAQAKSDKWNDVLALSRNAKVQVDALNDAEVKGRVRSVTDDAITVTTDTGDLRVMREDVWRVKVPSLSQRIMHGALGVMAGVLVPIAACPYCLNEGHSMKRGFTAGVLVGSLAFIPPGTYTVYKAPLKKK